MKEICRHNYETDLDRLLSCSLCKEIKRDDVKGFPSGENPVWQEYNDFEE